MKTSTHPMPRAAASQLARRAMRWLVILGLAVFLPALAQAQCASISVPTLNLVEDACVLGSTLACPANGSGVCADNGDTIRISGMINNAFCGLTGFRVVARVETAGGHDLLFGGPRCMVDGTCGAVVGWDDSYGMVINVLEVPSGFKIPVTVDWTLNDSQLGNVLGLPTSGAQAATVTVRLELFDEDFLNYFGSTTKTVNVERNKKNSCTSPTSDGNTALVATDKAHYEAVDTIYLELAALQSQGGEPAWSDGGFDVTVDLIALSGQRTGDPTLDCNASCGAICTDLDAAGQMATCPNLVASYSSRDGIRHSTPCGGGGGTCSATDEDLGRSFTYSDRRGTFVLPIAAAGFDDGEYILRVRRSLSGNGNNPVEASQVTYLAIGAIQTTPVTLSAVSAEEFGGGRVRLRWETSTEVGNVGFRIYAEDAEGRLRTIGPRLVPGKLDAITPNAYALEVEMDAEQFWIADVDVYGKARRHGPFAVGESAGGRPELEPVPWKALRAESDAKSAARLRKAVRTVSRSTGSHQASRKSGVAATYALRIEESGLYRVTYDELAAAGLDLAGVPIAEIAVHRGGEPTPVRVVRQRLDTIFSDGFESGDDSAWVVASQDAVFGPGAALELWADASDSIYTRAAVYQVVRDAALALPMAVDDRPAPSVAPVDHYLETAEVERQKTYSFLASSGDPWYDRHLLAFGSPVAADLTVQVDALATGAATPAVVEVDLWGVTDWLEHSPDHHSVVRLNGQVVADEHFDGMTPLAIRAEVPAAALVEGANALRWSQPGDTGVDWDMVALDRYAIVYPRRFVARSGSLKFTAAGERFEVTGLAEREIVVLRRQGGVVARVQALVTPDGAGGWTAAFPGTPESAEYRVAGASALLRPVEIAPARTISNGNVPQDLLTGAADYLIISHPDFLGGLAPLVNARETDGYRVKVVDVFDLYAAFGDGVPDPAPIREYIRRAAAELGVEMVLLVGGDTYDYLGYTGTGSISYLPSIYTATGPIVRFAPADPLYTDLDGDGLGDLAIGRLPVRSSAELASVIGKTLAYPSAGNARTAVFAADRNDPGVAFILESEGFASRMPAGWTVERSYLEVFGLASARADLLAGLNAGPALVQYFGHSGPTDWTLDGLFSAGDAARLTNAGRPSIYVQWGCWNTYHVEPQYNTLGHKLLLSGDRGAAAVVGGSTLIHADSERELARRLVRRLGEGKPLGVLIQEAKDDLAEAHPELVDVLLGWTLLGDPALVLEP